MPNADVVLVFPHKTEASVRWGADAQDEEAEGLRMPSSSERHQMEAWQAKRQAVTTALRETGLAVTSFYSHSREEVLVKVSASEEHLREVAEVKGHRLQLKAAYMSAFAEYMDERGGPWSLDFYQTYGGEDGSEDEDAEPSRVSLFRTVDRIQLADHAVRSRDRGCAGIDISELMHHGELLQYFPPHEGRKLVKLDEDWFRAFALGSSIDSVRDYFGERLAMRFLFLSHLHLWLVLPALIGPVLWLLDLLAGSPAGVWPVLRCTATGLWAGLLGHFWRPRAARHAQRWGTLGAARVQELLRPEFVGVSRLSPVTGQVERHYPWAQRFRRVAFSGGVLAVALAVLAALALVILALRAGLLQRRGRLPFQAASALAVEALCGAFEGLARGLTDRENHRTASEHSAHLLAKTVVFRFFICYSPLYYTAFFKEHAYLLGLETSCLDDDCFSELGCQLAVFVVVRIAVQHLFGCVLPLLYVQCWGCGEGYPGFNPLFAGAVTAGVAGMSRTERESKRDQVSLHEDMDSTLIMFGYAAFFAAACPLVPLLALVSCVLGCFTERTKLLLMCQRPFPAPAADNEPWDAAFDVFGCIAMVTNAALAVFTSHAFDSWTYHGRLLAFLLLEHGLLSTRGLVAFVFPALPRSVELLRIRQRAMLLEYFRPVAEEEASEEGAAASSSAATRPAPHIFDVDEDENDEVWG